VSAVATGAERSDGTTQLLALRRISEALLAPQERGKLLAAVLETLDRSLGFAHARILLASERGGRLRVVASRGYAEGGVGAEVALPGRADAESHLALPLVARDTLLGMLVVENQSPAAYRERDELLLQVVAGQIALALLDLGRRPDGLPAHRFVFYRADDSVFVDGHYLIRHLPGRILWKLLRAHADEGRSEFSNRELRLDPALRLPALRDNLESRLILLRRRLAEKRAEVALVPLGRGRFALDVRRGLELVEL
jgi:GAF domain-containing protein